MTKFCKILVDLDSLVKSAADTPENTTLDLEAMLARSSGNRLFSSNLDELKTLGLKIFWGIATSVYIKSYNNRDNYARFSEDDRLVLLVAPLKITEASVTFNAYDSSIAAEAENIIDSRLKTKGTNDDEDDEDDDIPFWHWGTELKRRLPVDLDDPNRYVELPF